MKNNVVLVGKLPPPIGGVTIHVQRLAELAERHGILADTIDYSKIKSLLKLFRFKKNIYHLHISNDYLRYLISLVLKIQRKQIVITFHSHRNKSEFKKRVIRATSRLSERNIAVGIHLGNDLKKDGIERVSIREPFLPPSQKEIFGLKCDLKHKNNFNIGINAYSVLLEGGKDIYGLESTIYQIKKIIEKNYIVYLYIYISGIKDKDFYNKLIKIIEKENLSKYIKFEEGKKLIEEMPNLNLFLRPTLTDSYGISVSEAIYLGIPAIASNVCIRDANALIFDIDSPGELTELIIEEIEKKRMVLETEKFNAKEYLNSLYRIEEQ